MATLLAGRDVIISTNEPTSAVLTPGGGGSITILSRDSVDDLPVPRTITSAETIPMSAVSTLHFRAVGADATYFQFPVSGGGFSAAVRRERLAAAPIGLNSYELLYRYLLDDTYSYSNMLTYFGQCGVNLVRVMYPCYSASEYTSLVFVNGVPGGEITDADFAPAFLAKSDAVFNAAAASGVKLQVCMFWYTTATASLFGETVISSLNTGSQTYAFMRRFIQWFGRRYGQHLAFGAFSFFNEQMYDVAGTANPTPANLGAVNSGLTAEMRAVAANPVATTDFAPFSLDTNSTRPTFVTEMANLRTIATGCDALGVHVYGYGASQSGMNYVGFFGNTTAAFGPSTSNKLGFEGLESFLSAMVSVAGSLGVPLWLTETGVPTDVDVAGSAQRRTKLLSICQQYADVSLVWNAADVASPQPNQTVWQIRPGTALGDTYKPLILGINAGRAQKKVQGVGAGTTPLRLLRQPKYCMTAARVAGATARVTSVAGMTSGTQAFMAWVRRDAALNNFEGLFDCRGAGNTSGFFYLAGATATTDTEYIDFRGASGSAGNTSGRWPRLPDAEWHHVAFLFRTIGGQIAIECWLDGMLWGAFAAANAYVGIPAGTTIYACGGSTNGAPVSMQDVTLTHYAAPEDIWAHMAGAVLPQSYLHLRADNGTVLDLSRSNLAVTIGSGLTTGPA